MSAAAPLRGSLLLACAAAALTAHAQHEPVSGASAGEIVEIADIVFAVHDGHVLELDLYLPSSAEHPPLLVWLHGGAWQFGSRKSVATMGLVEDGYALASVDFRLSSVARFPAQVHDIKAALRYLRASAARLGYDARRIGILGVSSGGHLAALVGVSHGDARLEGSVGAHARHSSGVQAIVSYYGASNLTTLLAQSTPAGLRMRAPALEQLLGGSPADNEELARLASPVFHVDPGDPPLMLLHGDQDEQMPINQSHELHAAYRRNGLRVRFSVVHGAGHGGDEFIDRKRVAEVSAFLDKYVRGTY